MLKNKSVIVFILVLVPLIALGIYKSDLFNKSNHYNIETYSVGNGFGYKISLKNKVIIKQDYIPAIQLKKPFCSEEEAKIVANLVCEKLNNKENPKITKQSLSELQVKLICKD